MFYLIVFSCHLSLWSLTRLSNDSSSFIQIFYLLILVILQSFSPLPAFHSFFNCLLPVNLSISVFLSFINVFPAFLSHNGIHFPSFLWPFLSCCMSYPNLSFIQSDILILFLVLIILFLMRFPFHLSLFFFFYFCSLPFLNSKFRNIVKELLISHHPFNFEQKESKIFWIHWCKNL